MNAKVGVNTADSKNEAYCETGWSPKLNSYQEVNKRQSTIILLKVYYCIVPFNGTV